MSLIIEVDRASRAPIYQQVAGQIKQQICTGQLPAGTRLPTIRQLAQQLGVTRLTVQTAYAELYFSECLWPDFGPTEIDAALAAYALRDRRFGGVRAHEAAPQGA